MEITARVVADATIATTKTEKQVVEFRVALNRRYKAASGEKVEQTEYIRCSYWRGTEVAKFLRKGVVVQLAGWLSAEAYEAKDGTLKAVLTLRVDNIVSLFGGSAKKPETTPAENITEPIDDLPF